MNLLSGLEKFGLKAEEVELYQKDEKKETEQETSKEAILEEVPKEEEFLLEKGVRCKICDKVFKTKVIKSGRIKRLESDVDLRPRHQYIDTLKYDIISCPYCGYSAMSRYFDSLTSVQTKLIKEQICANFKPSDTPEGTSFTYEEAIDRYKLSLYNTIVKKAKTSEIAYTCLKISWLLRGYGESLPEGTKEEQEKKQNVKKEEETFYQQAYDGFLKATASEMYPICGMEQTTVDFLIAYMSYHFGKLDVASRFVSGILVSQGANQRVKNKALSLKEMIIESLRNPKK